MVTVHAMRILADLSFYYAFASFIAVCFGSRYAVVGLLLQTVCVALSAAVSGHKGRRMAALIPSAAFFFLPGIGIADAALYLPAEAFILWQAWKGMYPLVWSRHVELFSVFWKFYAGYAALLLLAGMGPEMTAASIPIALIMLVTSVLLMRTLRHDPATYCQRRYQIVNILSVLLVVAAAAVISTETFLSACIGVFRWAYNTFVLPFLMAGLWCFVQALRVLAWLATLLKIRAPEPVENPKLNLDSAAKDLGIEELEAAGNPLLNAIMTALLLAAAAAVLYFFFRWMMSRGIRSARQTKVEEERRDVTEEARQKPAREWIGTPVQRVRSQYRKFLKLYEKNGGSVKAGNTSLEVERDAVRHRFEPSAAKELRDVYVRARYGGSADRDDAARARELYTELKKARGMEEISGKRL